MQREWLTIKASRQSGFSVIEVLLAATIFGFITTGIIGAIIYGRNATATAGDRARAVQLAEEGIEATRNIGRAAYTNLVDNSSTIVGDTTIEGSFDNNAGGTTAAAVTTGATGGSVSSISVYIKTVDAVNSHVQAALYADASGAPGARLGVSAIQTATANTWNTFAISGVTVAASTKYWIGLSEDGNTQFANGSGNTTAYHVTGGYPAPNPFAADAAQTTDKQSFYMTVSSGGGYGLAQSGSPLTWGFSGTSDTSDIFTRQVNVSTTSTNHKAITSTVTWPQAGGSTGTTTLTGRLTNWAAALPLWTNAVVAGGYDATGTTDGYRVFAQGNYAYLIRNVSAATNLFIVNISNPAAPALAGSLTLAGTPTNIYVSGTNAFVSNTSTTGELQIVNVANPAAPTLTSTFNAPGTAGAGLSVFVSGNFAYLGRAANTTNAELTIVNITNPATPTQAGIYSNNVAMNDIVVVPGTTTYAYIATNSTTAELLTVNVTNPAAPTLTNAFNTTPAVAATGLAINGTTAFVAAGPNLTAVNIATPATPTQTSTIATLAGTASKINIDVTRSFLFVGTAGTAAELQVFNVSNPASMTLTKSIDVSGTTSTVNGVSYNSSLDLVVAASNSDTQEIVIGKRN